MYTYPFGAPVPLELAWASGIGVEGLTWVALLVCLQLARFAAQAPLRRIAKRGAQILTTMRGHKPVPRSAA